MNTLASANNAVNTFFISSGKTGSRFTLRRSVLDEKRRELTTVHVRNLGVSLDVALETAEKYVKENHPDAVFCKEVGHIDAKPRRSTVKQESKKDAFLDALIELGVLSTGKYRNMNVADLPENYLRWTWANRAPKENPKTVSDADVCIIFNFIKANKLDEKFAQEVELKC